MVDYKNACIYKICCKDPNIKDVYIGSTCNLIRRRAYHKQACNNKDDKAFNYLVYRFIRANGGWDNWIMIKIKDTPCDNKDELRLKEREEFEKIEATLNSRNPKRSKKEFYEENKEEISIKHKEYRENNKEKIKERDKKYRENNREKIREQIKEINKQKVECECGSVVRKDSLSRHKKSLKHQNYLKSLEEK